MCRKVWIKGNLRSDTLRDSSGKISPVDSTFIRIKEAKDSSLTLFSIKIIEQVYLSKNFPTICIKIIN